MLERACPYVLPSSRINRRRSGEIAAFLLGAFFREDLRGDPCCFRAFAGLARVVDCIMDALLSFGTSDHSFIIYALCLCGVRLVPLRLLLTRERTASAIKCETCFSII